MIESVLNVKYTDESGIERQGKLGYNESGSYLLSASHSITVQQRKVLQVATAMPNGHIVANSRVLESRELLQLGETVFRKLRDAASLSYKTGVRVNVNIEEGETSAIINGNIAISI